MTYDVLKDFSDPDFKVFDTENPDNDAKVPIAFNAGDKFIPAETHYPQGKVDALVLNGTIKLVEKAQPAGDVQLSEGTPKTTARSRR